MFCINLYVTGRDWCCPPGHRAGRFPAREDGTQKVSNSYEDIIEFLQCDPEDLDVEYANRDPELTQEAVADNMIEIMGWSREGIEKLVAKLEGKHSFPDCVGQLLRTAYTRERMAKGIPPADEEEATFRKLLAEQDEYWGIVGEENNET